MHQFMGDNTHGIRVCGMETCQYPHPTWQSGQWTWTYVGVGSVECTIVTPATAFSRENNNKCGELIYLILTINIT